MLTELTERFPLLKGLLDFVYPPLCAGCGTYEENPDSICESCLRRIDWWDKSLVLTDVDLPPGDEDIGAPSESIPLFAAGSYVDPLQRIILQYKFHGAISVASLIARKVADRFGEPIRELGPTVLVPIPLHPSREYLRGYNQALIFADKLSEPLELPVDTNLLVRVKKRRPQSKLSKSKRAANIKSVFALSPYFDPAEPRSQVILVDDVVTSGQTLFEARRTLRDAGITVAGAIAMAHKL
ncbi:MAG: ComF family protein [Candidatus Zixiibacteriota bacterium]